MIDMRVDDLVESGCKRIYNGQNEFSLDLAANAANQCGIGNYSKIGISSYVSEIRENL
jgi:hypothetical protein